MLPQITPQEFLAEFDPSVHHKIADSASATGAIAFVMFENGDLSSSRLGERTALAVGPNCTYKTVEDCAGHHLNDLPSQRQYAKSWCVAGELAAEALKTVPPPPPKLEVQLTAGCDSATAKKLAETSHKIAAWLSKTDGIDEVVPCVISIGEQSWAACSYRSSSKYTADMACVQDGRHKDGELYYERVIYCVGKLPKSYGNRKVAYRRNDEDWYVSGHIEEVKPQFAEYHPFGANFLLRVWDLPEPIDAYSTKPYTRIQLLVEPLTAEVANA